jgi:sugar lactone lactonase YvrE
MKKLVAQLTCTFALLFVLGAVVPASAQVSTFVTFSSSFDQNPESIAIDKTGDIYVSNIFAGEVIKVTSTGSASVFASGLGLTLGVTTDPSGNVYALGNTALGPGDTGTAYKISPAGVVSTLASFPGAGGLNALAFDDRGNLYITDSFASSIYRVTPNGTASTWLQDATDLGGVATSSCGSFPVGALGANGIAFNHGSLYVLNTTQGMVVTIPVNPDGSPGEPAIFAGPTCSLWGADGQAFDNGGNLYVAVNIQNKIVQIAPSGTMTTVAAGSPPFFTPTAIAFGTTGGTQKTMFIANATLFSPGGTAGIVTLPTSTPGQPLP